MTGLGPTSKDCKSSPRAILKCTQSEDTVLLPPFSPQLPICPSRSAPQLAPSPAGAEIIKSDLVVFRTLIPKLPDVRITGALTRLIQTHLSVAMIITNYIETDNIHYLNYHKLEGRCTN